MGWRKRNRKAFFFLFPGSFLIVWENPDSDKSQAIDYFHSQAFAAIVTFYALGKERKELLLLTRSLITAPKLLLIFMNAVSFHFNNWEILTLGILNLHLWSWWCWQNESHRLAFPFNSYVFWIGPFSHIISWISTLENWIASWIIVISGTLECL